MAVIIYPLLHEVGHSISAVVFGAEIMNFQIFPIPSVLLEINSDISEFDFLLIGLSGMFFPFIISLLLPAKTFLKWYIRITLRLICIISFSIGIASVVMHQKGSILPNDDVSIILQNSSQYSNFCFVILVLLFITTITLFIKDFIIFNKKRLYEAF